MHESDSLTVPEDIQQHELDELNQLITRAQTHAATPNDIARMRDFLVRFPQLARHLGDLSGFSLRSIAAHAAADPITREAIQVSAQTLKRDLSRPGDTPLEKFAIDQCVNAHVLHYTIELRYIQVHNEGATPERSLYWERRLNNSQKRYLRALDNLARLRRFALPSIQINIAETQTNISAADSTASPDPASPTPGPETPPKNYPLPH